MKFIVKNTSLKYLKTDLLVVGIFKNNKINIALDKLFNNAVSKAVNIDNFKGDFKKSINLYGKDICRLKIVGLGSKKDFSSDKSKGISVWKVFSTMVDNLVSKFAFIRNIECGFNISSTGAKFSINVDVGIPSE